MPVQSPAWPRAGGLRCELPDAEPLELEGADADATPVQVAATLRVGVRHVVGPADRERDGTGVDSLIDDREHHDVALLQLRALEPRRVAVRGQRAGLGSRAAADAGDGLRELEAPGGEGEGVDVMDVVFSGIPAELELDRQVCRDERVAALADERAVQHDGIAVRWRSRLHLRRASPAPVAAGFRRPGPGPSTDAVDPGPPVTPHAAMSRVMAQSATGARDRIGPPPYAADDRGVCERIRWTDLVNASRPDQQADEVGGIPGDVGVVARTEAADLVVPREEPLRGLAAVALAVAARGGREEDLPGPRDPNRERLTGHRLEASCPRCVGPVPGGLRTSCLASATG